MLTALSPAKTPSTQFGQPGSTNSSRRSASPARPTYIEALLQNKQPPALPQALSEDYFKLQQSFQGILEQAEKQPVSEQTITPPWINQLKAEARKPEWQKTLGEYVLEQYAPKVTGLQAQYAQRSLMLEQKEKEETLAKTSSQYSSLNSSMASFEAQISGMTPHSAKAVFVGSGPQPNTVLSYAPFSKSVTGIDSDAAAIGPAQLAAYHSPYKGQIDFKHMEGKAVNYGDYSHIGMAIMIPTEAKKDILEQILNTANTGTRVVVRSVDGLKKALYDGIKEEDIKGLQNTNSTHPGSPQKVFKKVATLHGNDENVTHSYILEVTEKELANKKTGQGATKFGRRPTHTSPKLNLVG